MPLIKPTEDAPSPIDPVPVKVVDKPIQNVVVDSRYDPLASLLQFVEGSNWTVNYYSQVLDKDDELQAQAINRDAPYQQYWLIMAMELKVTNSLEKSTSQDGESKSMHVTGVSITPPRFIANKGDMFIADIGDGQAGVFAVTASEKKTYLKEALYEIQYELVAYLDPNRQADFDRKTIKTTQYVKDFLLYGQNPMVQEADFAVLKDLQKDYTDLLGMYLRDFFSVNYQTLLIPGQPFGASYDPFLTKAFVAMTSYGDHPFVGKIRMPGTEVDQAMECYTLWDAILGEVHLSTVAQSFLLMPTFHFKRLPQFSGIYYTGISQILYPADARTDVDATYEVNLPPMIGQSVTFAGRRYTDLQRILPPTALKGFDYSPPVPNALPDIVPITHDPYYVFTAGFYGMDEQALVSNLEVMTLKLLRGEAIDNQALHQLAQKSLRWENLERFYYTPVLIALLITAIRRN